MYSAACQYDQSDPEGYRSGIARVVRRADRKREYYDGEVYRAPALRPRGATSAQAGISSVKTVSPGAERAESRPDILPASSLAIASPSPDPCASSAV
jgi:hypothetical protein